jgi:hypothetical protein
MRRCSLSRKAVRPPSLLLPHKGEETQRSDHPRQLKSISSNLEFLLNNLAARTFHSSMKRPALMLA